VQFIDVVHAMVTERELTVTLGMTSSKTLSPSDVKVELLLAMSDELVIDKDLAM